MEYLLNNFSLKMVEDFSRITITPTDSYPDLAKPFIGDIVLSKILKVKFNPSKVELKPGDIAYVANVKYSKDNVTITYSKIRIL